MNVANNSVAQQNKEETDIKLRSNVPLVLSRTRLEFDLYDCQLRKPILFVKCPACFVRNTSKPAREINHKSK